MEALNFVKLVALTFTLYLISPLVIVLIILPCFFVRAMVKITQKFLKNNGENFVSPLSNLFATDDLFKKPTATLVLGAVFENAFTVEIIHKLITDRWLNKKNSVGKMIYSELCKFLEKGLLFNFWKNDTAFQVSNHVKFVDISGFQLKGKLFKEFIVQLINSPFAPKRSPWEIIVQNGYHYVCDPIKKTQCKCSLVLLKIHHSLVDGVSILNLCKELTSKDDVSDENVSKVVLCQKEPSRFQSVKALFGIPYLMAKSLCEVTVFPFSRSKSTETKALTAFCYRLVDKKLLKQLKTRYEVTLTSILLAGFVAAIKYAITKAGTNRTRTPHFLTCAVPVPLPGHPEGLNNHMSFVFVKLPVFEECPRKRLLYLHKNLEMAKRSLDPLTVFYLLKCIGALPTSIVKPFVRYNPVNFLLSSFPGPSILFEADGHRCKEIFFNGGLLQGNIRGVCASVGYEGSIAITVTAEETLLNGLSSDEFIQLILNEFGVLNS